MKFVDVTLWCDCESGAELKPVEEDWHGELKKLKCEKCGRKVTMAVSLILDEVPQD